MPKTTARLVKRDIDEMAPGQTLNDNAAPGFGVRRQGSGVPTFYFIYRNRHGRQRKVTIGPYGSPWTLDTARKKALELHHQTRVNERDVVAEGQATRAAPTVAALCDEYIIEAEAGRLLNRRRRPKKASTISTDKSRIEAHIKPLLGRLKVPEVTRTHVQKFLNQVAEGKTAGRKKLEKKRALSNRRGGKGAASRTVGLLGGIFTYAVNAGMRPDNPVHGVARFADGQRDRRLTDEEYRALGDALADMEKGDNPMWPPAVAAIRFLAITGWRRSEAVDRTRGSIDKVKSTASFESKTDRTFRVLSSAAIDIVKAQGDGKSESLLFPPSRGTGNMSGLDSYLQRVIKKAGLSDDITLHILRHSYCSVASDLGYAEPTIGALVGHKGHSMTRRYIHSADAVLLAAANSIANEILRRMGLQKEGAVFDLALHRTRRRQ